VVSLLQDCKTSTTAKQVKP